MGAKRSRGGVPEIYQSTIYIDHHRFAVPDTAPAEELHVLAHGVIDLLAGTLVQDRATNRSTQPLRRGLGLNKHVFERGWPIFRPRVLANTPSGNGREKTRRHYGYDPEGFDQARWADAFSVVGALSDHLSQFRQQITGNHDQVTKLGAKDAEIIDIIEDCTFRTVGDRSVGLPISSYRLASAIVTIGNGIIGRECELLELNGRRPTLELGSLEIWPEGKAIRTRPAGPGI